MAIVGSLSQGASLHRWVPYRTGLQPSAMNFRRTMEIVFYGDTRMECSFQSLVRNDPRGLLAHSLPMEIPPSTTVRWVDLERLDDHSGAFWINERTGT